MSGRSSLWLVLAGVLLVTGQALTQNAQPGQEPPRRRGGDVTPLRERMLSNIKEQMGVSEDQWKLLAPKVEKVMTLQRELRGGMGGRGGNMASPPESALAQAQGDLRTALENKDTPPAEIAQKLAAYRAARDKARAELQTAQKDLKEGAAPRQEAVLAVNGLID
jgi:hypothetical protein